LNFLTEGAETEIGERGINLSGGQKQRINLSRAVYSDADLFLLDDPFSAVDANVGKKLFQEVLSSDTGILKDKTRIVVTNNQGILPSFDNIIVLNNGTVSAVGSYEYLLQTNCEFVKHFSVKPSQEENRHTKVAEKNVNKEARKLLKKSLQEEEITNGKLSSLLSLSFLPKNYFVLFVLGHVATQLLRGASNYWLSVPSELKTINKLGWMSIYAWLGIFQGFSVFFSSTYLTKCILEISTKLHENFLARLLCSPMSFFETTPSGRVINRFSNDMNIVDEILAQTLSHLVQRFMELAASILTIVAVIPSFLFITVPVSFLYYLIQRLYTPVCHQVRRLYSTTSSPIFLLLNEALSGVSTVRAYGAERRFAEEFERRIDMNIGCYNVILAANRWLAVGLQFCGTVFVSSVALIAVIKRDSVNPALIGLALSYTANIKQILEMCVRESADIGNNVSAVERIAQYSDFPRESVWKGARDLTNWPQKGRIDFEDYSTTYRRGLKNVLENISFTIYPREKIGVVGRTGAGKSSLSMALFRILESTEGCIKIDDIDISSIGLHDLRSKITVMPQEPVLFTGTIRSNIDPFNEKSDQELWEVLEQSNLRNFIKDLKQGLQTHVFEGGDNFSVGQKQMICLSRALLRKSKILVLDEATAAVDMETDSMIQQTIRSSLFIDSTVITIAHRIHTIMKSDRILVLDKGKVAEFDKPNTLLADPSSLFSQLYRSAAFAENFF
jgi:ABC-type multidrug transport system fused ATPase/permease subunit